MLVITVKMSEVEVCQLAYEGNINELRNKITEKPENSFKCDQVYEFLC